MQGTPPRSDVDEILRRKRKAREYKACYPCRQRKVKCDQTVPCKTCVVREHPELCAYHPPTESHPPAKRLNTAMGGLNNGHDFNNGLVHIHGGTVTLPREVRLPMPMHTLTPSRACMSEPDRHRDADDGRTGSAFAISCSRLKSRSAS